MDEVRDSVIAILRDAYPEGVPDSDYPLLVVLGEGLSEENLGRIGGSFFGRNEHDVIYDAVAAVTTRRPLSAEVERVNRVLSRSGWTADD